MLVNHFKTEATAGGKNLKIKTLFFNNEEQNRETEQECFINNLTFIEIVNSGSIFEFILFDNTD